MSRRTAVAAVCGLLAAGLTAGMAATGTWMVALWLLAIVTAFAGLAVLLAGAAIWAVSTAEQDLEDGLEEEPW